jgi:iron complex transport system ATP-binding protein
MLTVRDLTLAVPGRQLCAGLSVDFHGGEVWGVLGANGAGKSTLLSALAGVRPPEAGAVFYRGRALCDFSPRERARHLALLLQDEPEAYWGTVADWVRLGRFPHHGGFSDEADDAATAAAMERAGVSHLAERAFGTLSGGERQRARLAQLLAQDGEVLLLDEPLKHLDLAAQLLVLRLFHDLARHSGKLVIMVLHDVYWVSRYCDQALLLFGDGRTVVGASRVVLSRDNMEALYRCPLTPVDAAGGRLFLPREEA